MEIMPETESGEHKESRERRRQPGKTANWTIGEVAGKESDGDRQQR